MMFSNRMLLSIILDIPKTTFKTVIINSRVNSFIQLISLIRVLIDPALVVVVVVVVVIKFIVYMQPLAMTDTPPEAQFIIHEWPS
jgi:hypothetical protein